MIRGLRIGDGRVMQHRRRAAQHRDGCGRGDHNADDALAAVLFCILLHKLHRAVQNPCLPCLRQRLDRHIRQRRCLQDPVNPIHIQTLPGIIRF